ncbi:MAG: hypothetical protein HY596_00620 [Candidatus Omnitrophica bacterium]|nr:hypothetical protein [Candidatus Omnitrophota bacterium]
MNTNERGVALGMVIVMALIFAVAAFGVMTLSVSRSQTSGLQAHRLKAQYAAEAGLVWAMQRLWQDQAYCGEQDPPPINGLTVDVTVTNCGPGNTHTLSAKVLY